MIINRIHPHAFHKAIKPLGGNPLKGGIGGAVVAHTVNHLTSLQKLLEHSIYSIEVILQIGIERDGYVGLFDRHRKSRQKRILMPSVAGELCA